MNIRLVAVDNDNNEIDREDNAHPDLSPIDSLSLDAVPRTGDKVVFYNTRGRDFTWVVVDVVWMAAPSEPGASSGYAHVCVMIRRQDS